MERNTIDEPNANEHVDASSHEVSTSKLPDRFLEKFINDKAENMRRTVGENADDAEGDAKDAKPVANPNSPVDVFIQMSTDANPEK